MNVYEVYWKETLIGMLYADEGKHKYEPNKEGFESVNANEPINPVLGKFRDWGEEIPLFAVRIGANERFENLEIGFHTDHIRMVKK